jgi:hypothetical protein
MSGTKFRLGCESTSFVSSVEVEVEVEATGSAEVEGSEGAA